MSDVLYRVRTVYETDTKKSAGEMLSLSTAAGGVSGALSVVGGVARTALTGALVGGIAAGVLGLAGLVEGVNHLNGAVDSTAVSIAGMVNAFGVEGTEGPLGWSSSMAFAEGAMAQIRRDAAALPGEADQFVEVFRAGLPGALEAGMQSADIAGFTNRFAAVGISFGVDAEQIGRDLNLILQGRAGAHVNMWNRLKSLVGKTAEEFNKLTAVQRQALIDTALRRYQPMIDAYANTWDAITSTTASYGKDLLRVATNPFFMVAKKELRTLNNWWGLNEKGIREYANGLGTEVVNAYKDARHAAEGYFRRVDAFVRSDTARRAWSFGERVVDQGSRLAGRAWNAVTESPGATASGVGMVAGVAMGIPGLGLVMGGLAQFATHTDAASSVLGSLEATGMSLGGILGTLWTIFAQGEVFLGDIFAALLPGLADGLASAIEGLNQFFAEMGPGLTELLAELTPPFEALMGMVGELAREIGTDTIERLHDLGLGVGAVLSAIASLVRWVKESTGVFGAHIVEPPAIGRLGNERARGERERGQGIAERLHTMLERIRRPLTAEQRAALGSARGLAGHTAGHPGRTAVNVTINQTVHTNEDADRILVLTRRAVDQGVHAPLQTPGVRVTH